MKNKTAETLEAVHTHTHTHTHTYTLLTKGKEVRLLFKPISFLYTSCKGGYNLIIKRGGYLA